MIRILRLRVHLLSNTLIDWKVYIFSAFSGLNCQIRLQSILSNSFEISVWRSNCYRAGAIQIPSFYCVFLMANLP